MGQGKGILQPQLLDLALVYNPCTDEDGTQSHSAYGQTDSMFFYKAHNTYTKYIFLIVQSSLFFWSFLLSIQFSLIKTVKINGLQQGFIFQSHNRNFFQKKELLTRFFSFQVSQVQLSDVMIMLRLGFASDFLFNILQDKLIPVQLGSKCVKSI